ncbi:MAG TPA: hypothetical protein DCM67_02705 [Propionibacteriaceae bacterium]|nr:hypothetical protein [Propionibacteriaceae bacterium]
MPHDAALERDLAGAGEGWTSPVNCAMCGLETRSWAPSCPRCGALLADESSISLLLDGPVDDHTRQRPLPGPRAYLPAESAIPDPPAAVPTPPERPANALIEPPGSPYPPPPPAAAWPAPEPMASAGQRLTASLIDTLALIATLFVILLAVGLFTSVVAAIAEPLIPVAQVLGWLVLLTVPIGYLVVLNGRGQTLGKRVLHIAVVDRASGRPIGIGRSAMRTVMMLVMWLPLGLGYLSIPLSVRLRGWHDQVADDTVVVVPAGYPITTRP